MSWRVHSKLRGGRRTDWSHFLKVVAGVLTQLRATKEQAGMGAPSSRTQRVDCQLWGSSPLAYKVMKVEFIIHTLTDDEGQQDGEQEADAVVVGRPPAMKRITPRLNFKFLDNWSETDSADRP